MADARNELLLSALRRASKPLTSGDVLDAATGLAEAEGWTPEQLANVTRKAVSKRLQNMAEVGLVAEVGSVLDEGSRRMTPTYMGVGQSDPAAPVPPPPSITERAAAKESPYDGLEKSQLIALLDVHDSLAQVMSQHLQDLAGWRERSRQRLLAVGLGER